MYTFAPDLDALACACKHQAVRLLAVFGSAVRGLRRPDSDLDLAVWMEAANVPPQDYYDSFIKVAQVGVLPVAFALAIAASTGLRNRLVHQYEAIDHAIVHSATAAAITQYTEYCRHITLFLDRHGLPPTV